MKARIPLIRKNYLSRQGLKSVIIYRILPFTLINILLIIILIRDLSNLKLIVGDIIIIITIVIVGRKITKDYTYFHKLIIEKIDESKKVLDKKYHEKLEEDINDLFFLIGNKTLFHIFLLGFAIDSYDYNYKDNLRFLNDEKGWRTSFKSSRKTLERYISKYIRIYEGSLQFLITYLVTLVAIKNEYLSKILISSMLGKPIFLPKRAEIVIEKLRKLDQKEFKNIDSIVKSSEKSVYAISNYKGYNSKSKENLKIEKSKLIKRLRKISFEDKIITIFEEMPIDAFSEMLKYYSYFLEKLNNMNFPLKGKLEYLALNGYNFYDYIRPDLRNKSVHKINIRYIETQSNLCGIKTILRKNNNSIITIDEYFQSICKLYALYLFLDNRLLSPDYNFKDDKLKTYSYDLNKIITDFRNPQFDIIL